MPEKSEEKQENKECILTIKLTEEGKVLVSGPLENEPLCVWLLDKAKDIIKADNLRKAIERKPKVDTIHRIIDFARGR